MCANRRKNNNKFANIFFIKMNLDNSLVYEVLVKRHTLVNTAADALQPHSLQGVDRRWPALIPTRLRNRIIRSCIACGVPQGCVDFEKAIDNERRDNPCCVNSPLLSEADRVYAARSSGGWQPPSSVTDPQYHRRAGHPPRAEWALGQCVKPPVAMLTDSCSPPRR